MWGILHMLICYAQPFVLIQAPFIWVQLEMVSQTEITIEFFNFSSYCESLRGLTQITSNNPYFSIL
jgi:hypothetical protein